MGLTITSVIFNILFFTPSHLYTNGMNLDLNNTMRITVHLSNPKNDSLNRNFGHFQLILHVIPSISNSRVHLNGIRRITIHLGNSENNGFHSITDCFQLFFHVLITNPRGIKGDSSLERSVFIHFNSTKTRIQQ